MSERTDTRCPIPDVRYPQQNDGGMREWVDSSVCRFERVSLSYEVCETCLSFHCASSLIPEAIAPPTAPASSLHRARAFMCCMSDCIVLVVFPHPGHE